MLQLQFLIRLIFAGLFYSTLLIGPFWLLTDSWWWPRGWLTVGLLWATQCVGGIWMLRNEPDLLAERMSPGGNSLADKLATLLIVVLIVGWFVMNPIDVVRWQLLPELPAGFAVPFGVVLYASGIGLVSWTFRTNTFAASVVRVQSERHQQVIVDGPYALVRHPMYAGLIPMFAGMSLIMGSTAVALFVVPMVLLGFMPRVFIEEATLRTELEGYDDYLNRTRWRIVPGLF